MADLCEQVAEAARELSCDEVTADEMQHLFQQTFGTVVQEDCEVARCETLWQWKATSNAG